MRALAAACAGAKLPLAMAVRLEDGRQRHPNDRAGELPAAAVSRPGAEQPASQAAHHPRGSPFIEELHFGATSRRRRVSWWDICWIWGPPEDHLQTLAAHGGARSLRAGHGQPLRIPENADAKLDLLDLGAEDRAAIGVRKTPKPLRAADARPLERLEWTGAGGAGSLPRWRDRRRGAAPVRPVDDLPAGGRRGPSGRTPAAVLTFRPSSGTSSFEDVAQAMPTGVIVSGVRDINDRQSRPAAAGPNALLIFPSATIRRPSRPTQPGAAGGSLLPLRRGGGVAYDDATCTRSRHAGVVGIKVATLDSS